MDFLVNNEIELGNAIWSSQDGDKIILSNGKFGNIPIKTGVSYEFSNDSSASEILGLGMVGNWSAGTVKIGETEIINPKIDKDNIKLYYIFQKRLPFNSRFENHISFVHANGVIINVLGNDKQGFVIGNTVGVENQLPKAIVNIIVPVLDDFDIDKADSLYINKIFSTNLSNEEKTFEFESHQQELEKKGSIEKKTFNHSIGLQLSEMEYKGLWALNSFIREYCLKTNERRINGLSIPEFKDGLGHLILRNLTENKPFMLVNFIGQFANTSLNKTVEVEISNSMLNSKEYSISNYINYQLNQLNYSFATISMYQEFESEWVNYSPNQRDKWGFIENYISDNDTKSKLAEMINAPNNIIHSKKLMTSDNPSKNKLRIDWGACELNEFEIYIYKKPFEWNTALKRLKNSIQQSKKNSAISC